MVRDRIDDEQVLLFAFNHARESLALPADGFEQLPARPLV